MGIPSPYARRVKAAVALLLAVVSLSTQTLAALQLRTVQTNVSAAFLPAGKSAHYIHVGAGDLQPASVKSYSIQAGPLEQTPRGNLQWISIASTKMDGRKFRFWLLSAGYPPDAFRDAQQRIERFIFQEGDSPPREFRNRITGKAVLPTLGAWPYLIPRAANNSSHLPETFANESSYLGHTYRLDTLEQSSSAAPPPIGKVFELLPQVLVGVPSNTRQKDETRRYDGSDYQFVKLGKEDFSEMADAGINCVRVDLEQLPWIADLNVFYWGIAAKALSFPECLYDSRYLGPALFLDEPAVCTRDHVIRPHLAKDPNFRKSINPQIAFQEFTNYFDKAWRGGAATSLLRELSTTPGVDLGQMQFLQQNLFSWETMVSTAAYQLSRDPHVPAAIVFEPPGRVGTRRTVPELNMTYGCQLPLDDPKNLIDIIYGFLRGAARVTGKDWGTSIYGAVDRADAPWFITHAYDLGATRFFFWDNAAIACVPYHECLNLARTLKMHVENVPQRNLDQLKRAAEVAILLPPGYNLGHVQLGKGSLWGIGELNLERMNRNGVKHRQVMRNFFIEIERCLRLGVAFDLFWDLPGLQLRGYREIVVIREDGKIEVSNDGRSSVLNSARMPARPSGAPPQLKVKLSTREGKAPLEISAIAEVIETSAPVYYTLGTDSIGVCRNAMVAWELYGPAEEDYRFIQSAGSKLNVITTGKRSEATIRFQLARPGEYRLRVATVDLAGRTAVVWVNLAASE